MNKESILKRIEEQLKNSPNGRVSFSGGKYTCL